MKRNRWFGVIPVLVLVGCGRQVHVDKADSLVVDSTNGTAIYGKITFALIGGGIQLGTGNPEPAGPVTVLVVRNIAAKDEENARKKRLQVGCAYLVTKDGRFKFIRRIDTGLTDQEIGKQFGVGK